MRVRVRKSLVSTVNTIFTPHIVIESMRGGTHSARSMQKFTYVNTFQFPEVESDYLHAPFFPAHISVYVVTWKKCRKDFYVGFYR